MYLYKATLNSIQKTKSIAEFLFKLSKKGDIFALYGDIGVGKTTFVRSLIHQLQKKYRIKKTDKRFNASIKRNTEWLYCIETSSSNMVASRPVF